MFRRYLKFVRALAVDPLGRAGVVLTTSSAIMFLLFLLANLAGVVTNAYVGLISFLALPGLFILGLVLIPVGWYRTRRKTGLSLKELVARRFGEEELEETPLGAPLIRTLVVMTSINVAILVMASVAGLHFMDQPEFCGTACHKVMNPEWVVYQQSPHARVRCVQCHVGEGVKAHIDAKLNGLRQIWLATFNRYRRPIPTPVHNLRPARETCEKCHWPEKFYGNRLKTIVHYGDDEASTPRYTTLSLKVNGTGDRGGIHWHVAGGVRVRYASLDDRRQEMIWVEVVRPDGSTARYVNRRLDEEPRAEDIRTMDCVDCHNRATHIYETPESAVENRIRLGLIDRSLPFIKREGVAAIAADYPSAQAARRGIEGRITAFYRRHDPSILAGKARAIEQAVEVLYDAWTRNVHPYMNLSWGTYPSLLGHRESRGCFRCHNRDLVDEGGRWIPDDCTLCHSILADEAANPFRNLGTPEAEDPLRFEQRYLREEFLHSYTE